MYTTQILIATPHPLLQVGLFFLCFCLFMMAVGTILAYFLDSLEDYSKLWKISVILSAVTFCVWVIGETTITPYPEPTVVTAKRIDDTTHSETSAKNVNSTFIPYLIQDGTDSIFYVRIYNGSVTHPEIILYKYQKN